MDSKHARMDWDGGEKSSPRSFVSQTWCRRPRRHIHHVGDDTTRRQRDYIIASLPAAAAVAAIRHRQMSARWHTVRLLPSSLCWVASGVGSRTVSGRARLRAFVRRRTTSQTTARLINDPLLWSCVFSNVYRTSKHCFLGYFDKIRRLLFIACQRAMHTERDIVLPILSVCLSVRLINADTVFINEWTNRHTFWHSGGGITLVFSTPPPLQNFKRTAWAGGVKYGVGQFGKYCPLSPKRYEIGP